MLLTILCCVISPNFEMKLAKTMAAFVNVSKVCALQAGELIIDRAYTKSGSFSDMLPFSEHVLMLNV